jgi:hypothetical protein
MGHSHLKRRCPEMRFPFQVIGLAIDNHRTQSTLVHRSTLARIAAQSK